MSGTPGVAPIPVPASSLSVVPGTPVPTSAALPSAASSAPAQAPGPPEPIPARPTGPEPVEPLAVAPQPAAARPGDGPAVEIVIPVHNEEADVGPSVRDFIATL